MGKRIAVFILSLVLALTAGIFVACSDVKVPQKDEQRKLTKIEITAEPTKIVYLVGEELDLTGLVVTAHYSDKTSGVVTDYTWSGYDKNTEGNQTITVTYQQKTATFRVTVTYAVDPTLGDPLR